MAWNTARAKYRSTELAALDCSPNTRQARTSGDRLWGSFTFGSTSVLAAGECIAMVRVPAGAVILGMDLFWNSALGNAVLAVGDPYACGRFLGPVNVNVARGQVLSATGGYGFDCGQVYGSCGHLNKLGIEGDGCGIGYTYTCETDIFVTNLPNEAFAGLGGWRGAYTAGSKIGAAVSAGKITLVVDIKPV